MEVIAVHILFTPASGDRLKMVVSTLRNNCIKIFVLMCVEWDQLHSNTVEASIYSLGWEPQLGLIWRALEWRQIFGPSDSIDSFVPNHILRILNPLTKLSLLTSIRPSQTVELQWNSFIDRRSPKANDSDAPLQSSFVSFQKELQQNYCGWICVSHMAMAMIPNRPQVKQQIDTSWSIENAHLSLFKRSIHMRLLI